MMVDTRVYGFYDGNGGFLCTGCSPERDGDTGGTLIALTYLDDEDPHGTTCDACYGFIFEPVEPHATKPDGTCDYGCFNYCGDTESCALHRTYIGPDGPEEDAEPETLSTDALATLFDIASTYHPSEED